MTGPQGEVPASSRRPGGGSSQVSAGPQPARSSAPAVASGGVGARSLATLTGSSAHHVPTPLVVAANWAWRLLVVVAALALLFMGVQALSFVAIPLFVGLLLAVLLTPLVRLLTRFTPLCRGWASLLAVVFLLLFVSGMLGLAGTQIASGVNDMRASAEQGLQQVMDWLATGPLQVSAEQLNEYVLQAQQTVRENSNRLTSGALAAGGTALEFLTGSLIALITTFFLLAQGDQIWRFLVRMLPRAAQERTNEAFRRGWVSLGSYARTQVLVAGVDAVGIGLGALILGLPFVIPLTLLVFFSSFIPIAGAIFSGAVAVLVALVVKGPVIALVMLGVVLLVQQLEAHVLQPFLMGHAVDLHPLAVIFAVAIGAHLFGIVGALFAVPVLAVGNTVIRYYVGQDQHPEIGERPLPPPESEDEHPLRQERVPEA